jgi:dTDP-4-amino-4,6-dideoxygalactose transaminase
MGSKVLEFEEAISSLIGAKACCVVNGTAALHLALLSCGVGEGDEVLVPSFTYVATYQAISAVGATPVHCEINPKTGTIDINDLREKITSKTKVIIPVHFIGSCDQIETIYEIAKELKLRVIEDAAHSFGGSDSRGRIGAHGDITCFSFDGIKNITCGEGGAVVSNNEQVIKFISEARLLGVENDSFFRYQNSRITKKIEVNGQGWRYHMSNIMAAIGIAQIKKIDDISRYRRKLAERYIQFLSNHERIQILEKDYLKIIPHTFGILLEGVSKEKLIDAGAKNRIELGYSYYPNHKLNYYSGGSLLPITERFYENLITLPMHLDLTADDQKRVCEFLFNFLAEYK